MAQILAIVSSKGGVGKTTTAVNIAAAFASLDFPTLLVEADPQCSLVACFGFDRFDLPRGLAEVISGGATLSDTTFETPVPGLHMISSNVWTQEEEAQYVRALDSDPSALSRALATLNGGYDYIVIDAPPMLGPVTMAVLAAADRYLVPMPAEPAALNALDRLVATANRARESHNPRLRFDGIALTMVDTRTRLTGSVTDSVRAKYPEHVFSAVIPRSVRLAEIPASGRPLVVAAPASRGARAYAGLAEEILLKHARERLIEQADVAELSDELAAVAVDAPPGANGDARRMEEAAGLKEATPAHLSPLQAVAAEELDALLGLPSAEEEWDDRFVDLDTYLKMESGGAAAPVATDESEWDEQWDDWEEKQ